MTLTSELNTRNWENKHFRHDYEYLTRGALRKKLKIEPIFVVDQKIIRKQLSAAVHFASSSDSSHREIAYRISVSCLALDFETSLMEEIKEMVKIVFNRLGNFPAAQFVFSAVEYGSLLSQSIWYECELKKSVNTVSTVQGEFLYTDFQKGFLDILEHKEDMLSVSAPTSAGKSFVLKNYLLDELNQMESGLCIYLVPSRALINQVYEDFLSSITRDLKAKIFISTASIQPSEFKEKVGLYILTQERLQTLLENLSDLPRIHYLVVDEAQNIGSDSRGVILQSTIEKIIGAQMGTKLVFSCPFVENTEIFNEIFYGDTKEPLEEQSSPVAQNMITVNANLEAGKLQFASPTFGFSSIGELPVPQTSENLLDADTLLSFIATHVSDPPTIIYSAGASSCEDIARELCKRLDKVEDEELKDFSEFIKTQVHPDFSLAEAVLHRVAFHYGPLPAILRRNIEDLFSRGKIHYLVCTSTLLQGVNLPAKNLFIMNATKGGFLTDEVPLTGAEFWNLAGRAGRLKKELEGNVFLINHSLWESDPLKEPKKYSIEPAYLKGLSNPTHLINVLTDPNLSSGQKRLEESTFMKMIIDYANGSLEESLNRYAMEVSVRDEYLAKVKEVADKIKLPSEVYLKNPSVSVYRQQQMYDYLSGKITDEQSAQDRIPMHPQGDSYDSIARLFKRIHTNFELLPGKNRLHFFFATLAMGWMRGNTISALIQARIDYKNKNKVRMHGVNPTIRELLKQVEEDLRFRYVKFSKCYIDILSFVLEQKGLSNLIEKIPSIPLYLELGCCSKNMINLLGLGLSRTTASLLTEHLPKDEMTIEETKSWLDSEDWRKLSLPKICMIELQRLIRG